MVFVATPFIPGAWGLLCLCLCTAGSWGGAQELVSPGDGGEGLGWLSSSSTHPVPGAHHLPGTLPQRQAGLFSPAP